MLVQPLTVNSFQLETDPDLESYLPPNVRVLGRNPLSVQIDFDDTLYWFHREYHARGGVYWRVTKEEVPGRQYHSYHLFVRKDGIVFCDCKRGHKAVCRHEKMLNEMVDLVRL